MTTLQSFCFKFLSITTSWTVEREIWSYKDKYLGLQEQDNVRSNSWYWIINKWNHDIITESCIFISNKCDQFISVTSQLRLRTPQAKDIYSLFQTMLQKIQSASHAWVKVIRMNCQKFVSLMKLIFLHQVRPLFRWRILLFLFHS